MFHEEKERKEKKRKWLIIPTNRSRLPAGPWRELCPASRPAWSCWEIQYAFRVSSRKVSWNMLDLINSLTWKLENLAMVIFRMLIDPISIVLMGASLRRKGVSMIVVTPRTSHRKEQPRLGEQKYFWHFALVNQGASALNRCQVLTFIKLSIAL